MIKKVFSQIFWDKDINPFVYKTAEIKLTSLFLGIIVIILILFGIFGDKMFIDRTAKKEIPEKFKFKSYTNILTIILLYNMVMANDMGSRKKILPPNFAFNCILDGKRRNELSETIP